MTDLINQASEILSRGAELLENPQIKGAVTGMFGLLKNAFKNNKRAKERLDSIEKAKADEKLINQIKTNLDDLLHKNESLQNQLAKKIKEIQSLMTQEDINFSNKTNTANIIKSNNINIIQEAKTKNININSKKSK